MLWIKAQECFAGYPTGNESNDTGEQVLRRHAKKGHSVSYYFSKTLDMTFNEATTHVTKALAAKGFGVLTTIDVRATMKDKLGEEFKPYTILGACNPHFAWRALQQEDKIGTMLPCNVIVSEVMPGKTEVAAVDPLASMASVDNPALTEIAGEVQHLLRDIVRDL